MTPVRVRYTRRARQDLLEIWTYLARQDPAVADRVYDRIEIRCRSLGDHPRLGRGRPDIADGARSIVIERWLAIYRVVDDGIQVVRIVDGARDLTRLRTHVD